MTGTWIELLLAKVNRMAPPFYIIDQTAKVLLDFKMSTAAHPDSSPARGLALFFFFHTTTSITALLLLLLQVKVKTDLNMNSNSPILGIPLKICLTIMVGGSVCPW